MGYSNMFSLKEKENNTKIQVKICPKCDVVIKTNFCGDCGTEGKDDWKVCQFDDIIEKFLEFSDDAKYLLDKSGNTNESGNGYNIEKDLIAFSENYPDVVFQLDCKPDPGFQSPDERSYIKNGKLQRCKVQIIFDEYDETKLV